jgi:hypothetical protein
MTVCALGRVGCGGPEAQNEHRNRNRQARDQIAQSPAGFVSGRAGAFALTLTGNKSASDGQMADQSNPMLHGSLRLSTGFAEASHVARC